MVARFCICFICCSAKKLKDLRWRSAATTDAEIWKGSCVALKGNCLGQQRNVLNSWSKIDLNEKLEQGQGSGG